MKRVAFVGSKNLGLSVLEEMHRLAPDSLCAVITIDDSQDVRCALGSFRHFSEWTGKPLRVLSKNSELQGVISECSPDLCIVMGWYWVLKPELLAMVPEGWLGIHASLLPKYRGGSPLVWAIINGEKESGLSLFYFDEGLDTGDIVARKKFKIGFDETIADVLRKVKVLSANVVRETYPLLINGTAPRMAQDHSQATYAAIRKPVDGRIDWTLSSVQIYNFVRAQSHPYPGAFCLMPSGETLRIWKAGVFPYPYYGSPGQVVMVNDDQVVVTCGDGSAVSLYTVEVDEQDEQNVAKVLRFGQRLR